MNKKELNFILQQGENQFTEFKESLDKSIAKEIIAFTNAQGGKIFLGRTIYVEKMGSGINRIKEATKLSKLPKPKFSYSEYSFSVEVKDIVKIENTREKGSEKTTQKTTQRILEEIKKNPSITRQELSTIIGITEDGIKFNLNKLKKQKLLNRIGPDKGGHWEIST